MDENMKVMKVGDVADKLLSTPQAVIAELEAGTLRGFKIGGEWRTTNQHLMAFVNGADVQPTKTARPIDPVGRAEERNTLTVASILAVPPAQWKPIDPFVYPWPGGKFDEQQEEAFTATFTIGDRAMPIVISFCNRETSGMADRRRANIFSGVVGINLYPVVEFVGANDFQVSGKMASVIKHSDRKHAKPGEPLPEGYEGFPIGNFWELVVGPYAAHSLCVIAHKDDRHLMARHALLRAYQRGGFQ
ncbi:MAG: hypothetical protein JWN14_3065 [Chthonomonadales bacterium]|nr:hypothetical protein [Chthonomonadales bacterium]